jgi:tetratricopeptide (TPR) repeat protein
VDGAIYLWERGLLDQAKNLTLAAKDIIENQDCDRLLIAEVYSFHACILSDSGDLDQASFYFERQVANRRQHLLELKDRCQTATMVDEIQLANAYNNLAGVYCAQGRYTEAELHNELSLSIKKRWEQHDNVSYLLSLSYQNIAIVCGRQGRFDHAATYFDKALSLSGSSEYTLRRALAYHNYGSMRLWQGQVDQARQLLETAYNLRWESLGDHHDTAASLHMLAACYQSSKDDGALLLARQVI